MCLISESTSDLYLLAFVPFTVTSTVRVLLMKFLTAKLPEELLEILDRDKVEVKHTLTAEDIMNKEFTALQTDASVERQ